MSFRISRGFAVSSGAILLASWLAAQQGNTSGGGNAGGGTPGGSTGGRSTTGTSSTCGPGQIGPGCSNNDPFSRRPIFLSGRVVMGDGSVPTDSINIERVCNGYTRTEGHTDRKGNFNIDLSRAAEFQDASMSGSAGPFSRGGSSDPFQNNDGFGTASGGAGLTERDLWNCELRASLAGYKSDVISLAGRRALDNPEVGTIVLRKLGGNTQGLMVSATNALAPKDAKKAYEKAMDALKKRNSEEARVQLEKATAAYPRYASAWLELGKLHEQNDRADEAKKAYTQAVAADSKFIAPYERLAGLALKNSNWQELQDSTDQILKLDPFTSPDAYYMNSIANLQLKHFDVSEKQALEAIKLDPLKKNMRSYYVLGLAQASQEKYTASGENLRLVVNAAPPGLDLNIVRKQLAQVEEAAQESSSKASR